MTTGRSSCYVTQCSYFFRKPKNKKLFVCLLEKSLDKSIIIFYGTHFNRMFKFCHSVLCLKNMTPWSFPTLFSNFIKIRKNKSKNSRIFQRVFDFLALTVQGHIFCIFCFRILQYLCLSLFKKNYYSVKYDGNNLAININNLLVHGFFS